MSGWLVGEDPCDVEADDQGDPRPAAREGPVVSRAAYWSPRMSPMVVGGPGTAVAEQYGGHKRQHSLAGTRGLYNLESGRR